MSNIDHLLVHSILIKRVGSNRVSDGEGGFIETETNVKTTKGRMVPASQKDLMLAGQYRAEVTHSCYLSPGEDVKVEDVLEFEGRDFVVRVPNITPSVPIYQKVMCLEVQQA